MGCVLYELAALKSPFKTNDQNLYALFQRITACECAACHTSYAPATSAPHPPPLHSTPPPPPPPPPPAPTAGARATSLRPLPPACASKCGSHCGFRYLIARAGGGVIVLKGVEQPSVVHLCLPWEW